MKTKNRILFILLPLLPIIVGLAALFVGRLTVTPADFFASVGCHLFGTEELPSAFVESALWNIRLPRIILASLCGAGLSAAGLTFQSLFSNPLATPDTLGVASGSSFGAAVGILLGLGSLGVQFFSLVFGFVAVGLTVLAGGRNRRGMNTTVLSGIMIGSLSSALVSFVKFTADTDTELPSITYWLMGNLDGANYRSILFGAPAIIIPLVVLFLIRWRLNILPLSDEEARSTGVNIKALRAVAVIASTVMTASVISMCGQVGWVGLIVPHVCRMWLGNDHRYTLPASVFTGAAFMIIVDTAARSLTSAEFPVSVLTAIIGAPFFIVLMRRKGGWQI